MSADNGENQSPKNEIRIEIRFKNALLWNEIRRALGLTDTEPLVLKRASEFLGVGYQELGLYLNLRQSPWRKQRSDNKERHYIRLRSSASKILSKLDIGPDAVFPPYLYTKPVPRLAGEIPAQHILSHIHERPVLESPEDILLRTEAQEQIQSVLRTLTPREEQIIKMRFGFDDGVEHTLTDIGASFGVTRERIRMIEAKALRKLRHPFRSRPLERLL